MSDLASAVPGPLVSRVGPYRIERRLGSGGMGVVYLGHDETTGTATAVKLVKPDYVDDPRFRDRLRREVAAAQRVPRFCTARVLAADLDADPPWVATEYIDAPSLDVVLLERGRLAGAELELFAAGVAVALREIHAHGVVHRDLKPSNVLLATAGPRVIDFGISWVEGAEPPLSRLTPTGAVVGTPRYMAPEQLRGEPATAAVDVFAWGSLVTYAATGRPPFGAGDDDAPEAIMLAPPDLGELAEPLRGLVAAALRKDPTRRPSTLRLVERLRAASPAATTQVLAGAAADPAGAGPDPAAVPPAVAWSRRRVLVTLAAVTGGAAAAAGAVLRAVSTQDRYQLGAALEGGDVSVDAVAVTELAGAPVAVTTGGFGAPVRVWDLATGDQVEELPAVPDHEFGPVAVGLREGAPVAVLGGEGSPALRMWDLASGERLEVRFVDGDGELYGARIWSVAVGESDGVPFAVSTAIDQTMRVWDLATGRQTGPPYQVYPEDGLTLELPAAAGEVEGAPFAVAAGTIEPPWARVWDLRTGAQLGTHRKGHTGPIRSVAFGRLAGAPVVLSGSQDHTVRMWDPVTGDQVGPALTGHSHYVRSVAYGEVDGMPIAVSGGNDGTVRVWDLAAGRQVGPELTGHTGNVNAVAITELDGVPIAVSAGGHNDGTVRRWRLPLAG